MGNMIPDLITDHLDIWTAAETPKKAGGRGRGAKTKKSPHGIKKLRELILELAVRGKLVQQDPDDEPASVLLEKITAEKERLIKKCVIKRQKAYPEVLEDEEPFALPENWKWIRISEAGHNWGQVKPDCRFTYIDVSAIDSNKGKVISPTILEAGDAPSRARKLVRKGAVIYSTVRPYLKNICVIEQEYNPAPIASTAFAIIQPYLDMPGNYFSIFLRSPVFVRYVESVQTGIAYPAINDKQFFSGVLPLPPLSEQHRIVAKVDELMALCDVLEQEQSDSSEAHQILVNAFLERVVKNASSNHSVHAELVEAFETLFTTEHSIDQLKQTILQLAVMGKLVPQDPNDEPASELLKKIATEKEQLIKEKKIKKQKVLPEITKEEASFSIPKEWKWVKFGLLAEFINGDRSKNYPNRSEYVDEGIPWINTGHIESNGHLTSNKNEMNFITNEKYESLRGGKIQKGDLVYCLRGATFGKTAFVMPYTEGAIASSLMIIRPYIFDLNNYIYKYLVSPFGRSQIFRFDNGSAQPNLSANSVTLYAFPLPPINEQHRIVAKVDKLMTLCDNLKERLKDTQTTQVQLADAIVEQAVG